MNTTLRTAAHTNRVNLLIADLLSLIEFRLRRPYRGFTQRPDFVRATPTDLAPLLDDVVVKARALAPRRWTVDGRAEGNARLDPQRITQALLQLATNAVRHTGPDDEIALGSRTRAGAVDLWVRDSGCGVPPEDRERIFARFQRGSAVRSEEGSGLGLSIVTAIAAAHGGSVALSSVPGRGATFTFTVPAGGTS